MVSAGSMKESDKGHAFWLGLDTENVFIVPTLSKTHPRLKDDVRFVTPGRLVRDENGVILYADGISI